MPRKKKKKPIVDVHRSQVVDLFLFCERGGVSRTTISICLVLFALLLRCCVGINSHSGASTPPMYGDYEAQRHWMEITSTLPISEWYEQSERNDLNYWGLDYPPLTAYVSCFFGKLAPIFVDGKFVALGTSHGYESAQSKLYMRLTVLVCDLLVFFPAVFLVCHKMYPQRPWSYRSIGVVLFLLHPCFVLIDHGHFQYNCICLGLTLAAVYALFCDRELIGSVLFCLSLGFKQMSLYYAPAFFFYLLGRSYKTYKRLWFLRVVIIGVTCITTFSLLFLPWLPSCGNWCLDALLQVVHRIFPIARGLFEDKVANFWCASTLLIKWRQMFELGTLLQMSLGVTVLSILPSGINVLLNPQKKNFVYCLACSSFGFFLFSFQVHEKTILFPLLPLTLLSINHPLFCVWLGNVSCFSMYPLLKKDGLVLPYIALQCLFFVVGVACVENNSRPRDSKKVLTFRTVTSYPVKLSYFAMVGIHLLDVFLPQSERYPDIVHYLFVILSAGHFVVIAATLNINVWKMDVDNKIKEKIS